MSKYTLHYFGGFNGRPVIIRAILSYVKADWHNNFISHQDRPKIKKSGLCEYEQLPVLEVNGKKYCENHAIILYLAETYNLLGKNPEENYEILNVLMAYDDYMTPIWNALLCQDQEKRKELLKAAENKVKFFIAKFEKKYVDHGKGKYFLGKEFNLADIVIGSAIPAAIITLGYKDFPFKEIAPNLDKFIQSLKENELKEFHEKYFFK